MTGYLILALALSGVATFFLIKSNISKDKKNKSLKKDIETYKKLAEKNKDVEIKKTEIREKYNEKENDINNSDSVLNCVMPIVSKPKHNHKFYKSCGKGCPAYTEK